MSERTQKLQKMWDSSLGPRGRAAESSGGQSQGSSDPQCVTLQITHRYHETWYPASEASYKQEKWTWLSLTHRHVQEAQWSSYKGCESRVPPLQGWMGRQTSRYRVSPVMCRETSLSVAWTDRLRSTRAEPPLTASHRRDFLLSVHLSYVVTGRRPWGAIIQVHQRLNIFPCCSQVYKHVLPKRKAMMQSHQLVT